MDQPDHVVMNAIKGMTPGANADAANAALSAWVTQLVTDDSAWGDVNYTGVVVQ